MCKCTLHLKCHKFNLYSTCTILLTSIGTLLTGAWNIFYELFLTKQKVIHKFFLYYFRTKNCLSFSVVKQNDCTDLALVWDNALGMYVYSNLSLRPPANNDHYFGVPRVVIILKFDCIRLVLSVQKKTSYIVNCTQNFQQVWNKICLFISHRKFKIQNDLWNHLAKVQSNIELAIIS
jgi:hypothetical protein